MRLTIKDDNKCNVIRLLFLRSESHVEFCSVGGVNSTAIP